MRLLVLIAVSVVASTASADVAAVVGAGVSRIDDNGNSPILPALDVFLGATLDAHWSIGGRLQTGWPVHSNVVYSVGGGGDVDQADLTTQALDLGLSARYEDHGWWLAPWIGEHVASVKTHEYGSSVGDPIDYTSTDHGYALELGLMAGVDVYSSGIDRLTIYADYHHALGSASPLADSERTASESVQGWSALTVGLAYRR